MEINELIKREGIEQDKKLTNKYIFFEKLINELRKREIPSEIIDSVNQETEVINSFSGSNKTLLKRMRKAQPKILRLLEKELKIVTKNHYRNLWLAIGMAGFGIPFGVAFGASFDNMAFLGLGIPIGMVIGIVIGTAKDKEANKNGNQLDIEAVF